MSWSKSTVVEHSRGFPGLRQRSGVVLGLLVMAVAGGLAVSLRRKGTDARHPSSQPDHTDADQLAARAREWYRDPRKLRIAQKHDGPLEVRFVRFTEDRIREIVGTAEELEVWDIGCGEGLLAGRISQRYSELSYTGFDPHPRDNAARAGADGKAHRFIEARASEVVNLLAARGGDGPDIVCSSLNFALWDNPEEELRQLAQECRGRSHILIIDLLRAGSVKPVFKHLVHAATFFTDQYNASCTPDRLKSVAESIGRPYQLHYYLDTRSSLQKTESPHQGYGSVFVLAIEP